MGTTTTVQTTTKAHTTVFVASPTLSSTVTFNFTISTEAADPPLSVTDIIFGYLSDELILVGAIAIIVLSAAVCTFVCIMKHLFKNKKDERDASSQQSSTVDVVV